MTSFRYERKKKERKKERKKDKLRRRLFYNFIEVKIWGFIEL
jgi:hypothetical protein